MQFPLWSLYNYTTIYPQNPIRILKAPIYYNPNSLLKNNALQDGQIAFLPHPGPELPSTPDGAISSRRYTKSFRVQSLVLRVYSFRVQGLFGFIGFGLRSFKPKNPKHSSFWDSCCWVLDSDSGSSEVCQVLASSI